MFHRLHWEAWHLVCPVIGFVLIFTVFILVVLRAAVSSRKEINHASSLPLEGEEKVSTHERK